MELTDSSFIFAMIAASTKAPSIAPKRAPAPRTYQPRMRTRCECGQCPSCVEAARWERIYQEKFADANYYRRSELRYASPLSSL